MRGRKKSHRFRVIKVNKIVKSLLKYGITIILLLICSLGVFTRVGLSELVCKYILCNEMYVMNTDLPVFKDFSNMYNKFVLRDIIPGLGINTPSITDDKSVNEIPTLPETTPETDIPKNTFPIIDRQIPAKNLDIRNETTYQPDIESLLYSPLSFSSPEILIVHTHATESYKTDDNNYYYEDDPDRTIDTNLNVVRVGDELAKHLERYGFRVTHARDINDYPSYNQSYNKTLGVIEYYLKQNPNIQIVIDLHRDSVVSSDGIKSKFTTGINGKKTAQIMLVCGTNQAGLDNDTWQENLKFTLKLQNYMEVNFPGLARPLNIRQERFNTHATFGSFIIEVGTSGNTLNEALNSTEFLAKAINDVLLPYK